MSRMPGAPMQQDPQGQRENSPAGIPDRLLPQDAILNLEEAAAWFGVSVKTFIKLLREEDVPARKIGREWRFSRDALMLWLGGGRSRQYSDSEQETKRFFDAMAPGYDASRDAAFNAAMLGELEKHCPPPAGGLSLDYGAGTGVVSQWIAGRNGRVLALDVSSGMMAELNRQAAAKHLDGVSTRLCDIGEVPVETGTAVCVYATFSLHHAPDPTHTLRELRRTLQPGGRLAVVEYHPYLDEAWQEARHDVWPGLDARDLENRMRDAGFRHAETVWHQPTPEGREAYLLVAEV